MTPTRHSPSGWFGSSAKALGILASFLLFGCQSTSTTTLKDAAPGATFSWPDVMTSWQSPRAGSIYSLSFFDPTSSGLFVRSASYATDVGNTCEVYSSELYLQASSVRDDWVLLLHVSNNGATQFKVDAKDTTGGEPLAQVIVKHVVHGKEVERHTGLAGTIEVTSVPATIDHQNSGMAFVVHGTVEFSEVELLQRGCSVGGSTLDGGGSESTCTCIAADGRGSTCDRGNAQVSCCIDTTAPRRTFPIAMSSVPCGNVCVATSMLLQSNCLKLGASGSSL